MRIAPLILALAFLTACSVQTAYSDEVIESSKDLYPAVNNKQLSTADTQDASFNDNPPYYSRGADRDLCKEVRKLLLLPENKDYLYSKEKLEKSNVEERQQARQIALPLFVPRTKEFKNFTLPIWSDVNSKEAKQKLPDFIGFIQEESQSKSPLEVGGDYKIQEAQIDMNVDGSPETVYRSVNLRNKTSQARTDLTNFLSIHPRMKNGDLLFPGLHRRGQLILYKKEPVFFNKSLLMDELFVQPSLEDGKITNALRPYEPLGCTFSSTDSRYLGD